MGRYINTTPDPAAEAVAFVDEQMGMISDYVVSNYDLIMRRIYESPDVPAQQFFDRLGTEGVAVLAKGRATKAYLETNDPARAATLYVAPVDDFRFTVDAEGRPASKVTLVLSLTVTGPEGAAVTVNGASLTIGAGGAVTFAGLTDGTYVVTSALDGYIDSPVTVQLHKNATVACGLAQQQGDNP